MNHRVRKAFVLGAGLGTRLRPLTKLLPKPLLPVYGKPLITFALDHLRQAGIEQFWVNSHHLPEKFLIEFPENNYNGAPLEMVHEADLLETGGGIKNIEHRIGDETFIVYSGDILTDVPIHRLVEEHFSKRNDVTLALRITGFSPSIHWCRQTGRVVDLLGALGSGQSGEFDFAGISIWSHSVFSRIPPATRMSFIPVIIEWMKAGGRIGGLPLEEGRWLNLGSRKEYLSAHRIIAQDGWVPDYLQGGPWPVHADPSAKVSLESKVEGASYLGAGCKIEGNVLVENSILFPGSTVLRNTTLRSCIVAGVKIDPGVYVETDFV